MFLSKLKKSNPSLFLFLFVLTGCSSSYCPYEDSIEIPPVWHTSMEEGMSLDDPLGFIWWEALNDPMLTALVDQAALKNNDVLLAYTQSKEKWHETLSTVTSEISKNYIELRGFQTQLKILESIIAAENKTFVLNESLSTKGFFSLIDKNENKKALNSLLVKKSHLEFSIKKISFHISTLLGYPPGVLCDHLERFQKLPDIPPYMPIGYPMHLIQHNLAIKEAKKEYEMTPNTQAFYNYQKTILNILEEAEVALASFVFELNKTEYLKNISKLKNDSYLLIKDLYQRGLKDDQALLGAYQEVLSEETSYIQSKVELLSNYVSLYQVLVYCREVN